MTTNNKGRNGGDRATPWHFNDSAYYIKPSRINRRQKSGWKAVQK